jgi:peroxiredoxin
MTKLSDLPSDLPVPADDGACDHLTGLRLPYLPLPSTKAVQVSLASLTGVTVVYIYPMTGRPGIPLPDGWDQFPGARGCTPQSCSFRDHHDELKRLNAEVYGLSTQSTPYQCEAAERLHLPFALLSDETLKFAKALNLPTMEVDGMTLIKRTTLVCDNGRIKKVFYPVFPPDRSADEVIEYLNSLQG